MRRILNGDPEAIIPLFSIMYLTGVLGCLVSVKFGGFGILTCAHLLGFGVLAASMTQYKTDKGLWMLALFLFVFYLGLMAMWMCGTFVDFRRGKGLLFNGSIAVDAFLGLSLGRLMVRFLWKTAKLNYLISIKSE